jgi:hypothetical protein
MDSLLKKVGEEVNKKVASIIEQVAWNKSSLLLKLQMQSTQTL